MTQTTREVIWQDFRNEWGAWIPEVYATDAELAVIAGDAPAAWLRAVAEDDVREAVMALWQPAARVLPRFVEYLANEVVAIAIGQGELGYSLLYFVRSCGAGAGGAYEPGYLFGSEPTPQALIDDAVAVHGALPESLIALWRMHGFFRTKEESVVAALAAREQRFAGAPRLLEPRHDGAYECLAVVDATRPMQLSLVRDVGAARWDDHLVFTSDGIDRSLPSPWRGVDGLLTDWTATDYRPGR